MGKWKNIILGEKMPDKDDPKYRDKYEKDVEAGKKFARVTRIDRLAGHVQRFAEKHRGVFLGIVMALVLGCLAVNIYHFTRAYRAHRAQKEMTLNEMLYEGIKNAHTLVPVKEKEDGKDDND